ncbi:MAG: carboxypeptidase-like regulatory domain-containing protein [Gemmatimonadaceae bacterium]
MPVPCATRARGRAVRFRMLPWAAVALLVSCTRDAGGGRSSTPDADSVVVAAAAAVRGALPNVARAIASGVPYRVVAVSDPGSIRGVITLDTVPVLHDTTLSGDEATVCGARMRDGSVAHSGHELEGALVWVSDARQGQALTSNRRADLAIVRCQFVPRMLALVQGTTINLQSKDAIVHHTRFYSELEGELLSHMLTVDRWAVVPSARIAAQPGLVRVRLSQHPYVRGFVAVFDHPYFAVSDRYGRYAISGLPAGTYHVRVWHERADSVTEQIVTVEPGRAATLNVKLELH